MASITPKQAREYLHRWRLVGEIEAEESRTASLETKFRQLATLMASRNLFRDDDDRERQLGEVRDRWDRIRQAMNG